MDRSTEEGSSEERGFLSESYSDAHGVGAHRDDDPERHWLQRTIETEIIPRLMLAHRANIFVHPDSATDAIDVLEEEDVESFAALVLRDDVDACTSFVGALRERGVPLDQVFLGLMAPVARRMGAMWEADECDFAQVTLALWRLQSLVLDLSPQMPAVWHARPEAPRRALLAAAPGSQHTLGLLMVSEFFRRAGWDVWSDPSASEGDLVALMRSEWFDLVGLSVGMDGHVQPLRSVILALRRASRNPQLGVMVGGPIVLDRPQLIAQVGADFTASDARQAVERAESFVATHARAS